MDVILGQLVRNEIDEAEAIRRLGLLTGAEKLSSDEVTGLIAQSKTNPERWRGILPVPTTEADPFAGGVSVRPDTEEELRRAAFERRETERGGAGLSRRQFLNQRFGDVSPDLRERLGGAFPLAGLQAQHLLDMFGVGGAQEAAPGTFAQFLSQVPQRADPANLSSQLVNLMGQLTRPTAAEGPTPFQQSLGEEVTGTNLARSALEPTLAALPPGLRAGFLRAMQEEFRSREAGDPLAYDDPTTVGRNLQSRGFFGSGFGGWGR